MNSLLDKQHIGKRRSTGKQDSRKQQAARRKPSSKPAFRPKGIVALFEKNSKIIEGIRQEPSRIQRKNQPARPAKAVPDEREPLEKDLPPRRFDTERTRPAKQRRERSWSSFALSAGSITAVFLVILGVLSIIHSQDGSLDWTGRDVIAISGDSASRNSLARYAGISLIEPHLDMAEGVEAAEGATVLEGIPLDLMETFAWQSYRVRRGDSVSTIAAAFSVSMDAIIASNGITNARALREGEILRIPNMDGIPHIVRTGDSLVSISQAFGVPLEAILDANDIQSDVISPGTTLFIPGARMNRDDLRIALGDQLFVHPVRGARLTSPFGWRNDPFTGVRRHHAAIDLAAPTGTPIVAAKSGRVSALGYDRVFGNFIIITHANNFQTLYAHLHTIGVRRGDQVRQGARIGTVGNTGLSTGPHLHFAIYRNNRAVNPLDFLNNRN